jgi:membrane-bound serine protease (ClpP class)
MCAPLMDRLVRWASRLGCLAAIAVAAGWLPAVAAAQDDPQRVLATTISTEITPVVADQIADGIARANDGDYVAYVIELDTPGGLDTSMRAIVENILASEIPVIVYVTPDGARAASAGAVIALASHVAVMAPGTSIGAATPVSVDGEDLQAKIVNDAAAHTESLARLRDRDVEFAVDMVREGRSASADEAVELGVVDAKAASLDEALRAAGGRTVVVAGGDRISVATAGAAVDRFELSAFRVVLQFLANPNIAYLLMTIGTLGLIYELASPGVGVAGTAGAVCLVLGLFGLSVLPVNAVGILLLLLAAALFVAELFVPGVAGFAFGGAVTLVLAAMFLFDESQGVAVDLSVALPAAVLMAVLVIIAGRFVLRAQRGPSTHSGSGLLLGRVAAASDVTGHLGRVFLAGAWWSIRSDGRPLREEQPVRVTELDGLTLVVEPLPISDDEPPQDVSQSTER